MSQGTQNKSSLRALLFISCLIWPCIGLSLLAAYWGFDSLIFSWTNRALLLLAVWAGLCTWILLPPQYYTFAGALLIVQGALIGFQVALPASVMQTVLFSGLLIVVLGSIIYSITHKSAASALNWPLLVGCSIVFASCVYIIGAGVTL
jgi:hypothetical protein